MIQVFPKDSVYNYVECSDDGIGQELSQFFTFQVPGYKFMPAYKSGAWDGNIRLYNPYNKLLYKGLNEYLDKFAAMHDYKLEFEAGSTFGRKFDPE